MTSPSLQLEVEHKTQNPAVSCVGASVIDTDVAHNLAETLGQSVFNEVAMLFAKDARKTISDICCCFAQHELPTLASRAHSLKSSSAMLGCESLAVRLTAIENAVRKSRPEELDELTRHLPTLLQDSLAGLEKFCDTPLTTRPDTESAVP